MSAPRGACVHAGVCTHTACMKVCACNTYIHTLALANSQGSHPFHSAPDGWIQRLTSVASPLQVLQNEHTCMYVHACMYACMHAICWGRWSSCRCIYLLSSVYTCGCSSMSISSHISRTRMLSMVCALNVRSSIGGFTTAACNRCSRLLTLSRLITLPRSAVY